MTTGGEQNANAITDEFVVSPWMRSVPAIQAPVLQLVVAWASAGVAPLGSAARLDAPARLGGGDTTAGDAPPLRFHRSRPDENVCVPAFESAALFAHELSFEPGEHPREVRVRRSGPRALMHNGVPVEDCTARPGDTLTLEHTAVFLVEARPLTLPPCWYFPRPAFAFGEADPHGWVGESPATWRLREELAAACTGRNVVLLTGAAGSGKDVAADTMCALSPRANATIVRRCAVDLPSEDDLHAELFGVDANVLRAGAPDSPGLFALADGGIFVLTAINALSDAEMGLLERVLDERGAYHRIGYPMTRYSDFLFIATTEVDVATLPLPFVARFMTQIEVPGLDERRSDIPWLLRELLGRLAKEQPEATARFSVDGEFRLELALVDALLRHDYGEHVRELDQLLRLAVVTSRGSSLALTPELEPALRRAELPRVGQPGLVAAGEALEQSSALALRASRGNLFRAAATLGLTRDDLRRVMNTYGLPDE